MSAFSEAMRRIITADDAIGRSTIIIDGPPSAAGEGPLFEIWQDATRGALNPQDKSDLGPAGFSLCPADGEVKVRWFTVDPVPDGVPKEALDAAARAGFASFGAEHCLIDQTRSHVMHETESLDVICLLQGDASLILESGETRLKPGQVVVQRATNHAWHAHGGPALFLAVLINRPLNRD